MAKKIVKKKATTHKVFATEIQLAETKSEIASLERMLAADRTRKEPKLDEGDFKREIAKKQKFLAEVSPMKFRGQAGNKAFDRAKKLEKEIKEAMPSSKAYFQPYPKEDGKERDFENAVRQQMEFQRNPDVQQKVQELKHIMRRLDPSDPMVTNIERLRR